jgi:DNA-binding HxlR family transcriptional regulator
MFRTTSQQKNICKKCPIAKTADLVGDSIVLIIIRELISGPKRFGDMIESLEGVSTRTLTQKLKKLEGQNIISRTEYKEKPPRVEYSLTSKGKGLKKIVSALLQYGEKYL